MPAATDLPLGQATQVVEAACAKWPTAQFTHESPCAYLPATQSPSTPQTVSDVGVQAVLTPAVHVESAAHV